jgi:hypothetical protein
MDITLKCLNRVTHSSLVVAFLIVTRVSIALNRYSEARNFLGAMYRETRELTQQACVLSLDNTDQAVKEWRHELGYRSLLLLCTANAVIDFPTAEVPSWEVPELTGFELEDVKKSVFIVPELQRYAHW